MPAWFVIPLIQAAASAIQQGIQNRANRKEAQRAYERDKASTDTAYGRELELMKYQNSFNSPAAQMQRFRDAGLNPNLMYGQGTPGNMQAPRVPQQGPARVPQISIPNVVNDFAQARLMQAQTELIETKTDESGVKQDLMKMQREVTAANPYLKPGYVDSIVSQMLSTARMKEQEATFKLDHYTGTGKETGTPMGIETMQKQYDLLLQKWRLGEKDMKVKAEIIQSKEFQNDLSEIQRNWMRDGEITPEVIKQFLFMFLQSLMR